MIDNSNKIISKNKIKIYFILYYMIDVITRI